MAAKNKDSNRIFDLYVDRYLNEQLATGTSGNFTGQGWEKKKEATPEPPESAGKRMIAATAGMAGVNPYIAGQPAAPKPDASKVGAAGYAKPTGYGQAPSDSSAFAMKSQGGSQVGYDGSNFVAQGDKSKSGENFTAVGDTSNQPQSQSSWSLTSAPDTSLETIKTAEAVPKGTGASTGLGYALGTSPQGGQSQGGANAQVAKSGEPSAEEKALFKKLHGSDYVSGAGDKRLAELRSAVQQTGSTDVSKVAPAAYAQQYAGTSQGQAYAKRAEAMGVKVPKPGEVAPSPTNYAQQFVSPENQQAIAALQPKQNQNQSNYAQQASDLGLSPETQQMLKGGQGAAPAAPANTAGSQPKMDAQQFIQMGKSLGLSQSTLDEIQKQFQKS